MVVLKCWPDDDGDDDEEDDDDDEDDEDEDDKCDTCDTETSMIRDDSETSSANDMYVMV